MKNYLVTTTSFAQLNEGDRPREKALKEGIASLSDTELLAILFGTGTAGCSVIEMAQNILEQNEGHLSRITDTTPAELSKQYKGIGLAKAVIILGALELGRRAARDAATIVKPLRSSVDAYNIMRFEMEELDHEEFWAVMLSNSGLPICSERICVGGMTATIVDLRIIMRKALQTKATRMILYHNHPSGNLKPSMQDDMVTRKIKNAAKLFDIRVDDHIIIGKGTYYSYSDQGRMED